LHYPATYKKKRREYIIRLGIKARRSALLKVCLLAMVRIR
jgi:hypothetical protein